MFHELCMILVCRKKNIFSEVEVTSEKNFQVLLSCPIPNSHQENIPESVSIVESKCDKASNNLRVLYDKPSEMGLKERVHHKSDSFLQYSPRRIYQI